MYISYSFISVYKFLIRRRRFVRYMTTCIHEYKHPDVCVTQLQKQGILAHSSIPRKHHGHHRKSIKVTHRRFSYDGRGNYYFSYLNICSV